MLARRSKFAFGLLETPTPAGGRHQNLLLYQKYPKEMIMADSGRKGKHAVVERGGKNLGALVNPRLVEAGVAGIAVVFNRGSSKEAAQSTIAALQHEGADAFAFRGDLTVANNAQRASS
jgi:hypothetical protein